MTRWQSIVVILLMTFKFGFPLNLLTYVDININSEILFIMLMMVFKVSS